MSVRRRPQILCVSTSTSQLDLILSHLGQAEFEVVSASSPEEAVAFCAANSVTAIVLDSEFVTEDGWTVARSLRMVKPQLPIVLLKRNHDSEIPAGIDAVAAGADLVLDTLKILLAKVNQGTDHAASSARRKPSLMRELKAEATSNKIPNDDGKPDRR